jgi:wyosine [tRNA(Phe)-imidazoG37] synthetase (radical SAM superfamily)
LVRLLVVLPPLPLSRDFVDTPYLLAWNAYQAAAVARQSGVEVDILDGFAAPGAGLAEGSGGEAELWLGQGRDAFLDRLEGVEADAALLIGSPFLIQRRAQAWLEAMLQRLPSRRIGARVLADMYAGGSHYLDYAGARLRDRLPGLDVVLRYEGERLLRTFIEEVRAGRVVGAGERMEREAFPLDDLPPPAWDLMEREAYFDFLGRVLASPHRPGPFPAEPRRTLPLSTSRGCSYGCVFCTRNPGLPAPRRQVRAVPWPSVQGWMRTWVRDHGLERLVVLDEVANLSTRRFGSLLSAAEELGLRLEFPNGLRADRLSAAQLRRLCKLTSSLTVSLESASARVQRELLGKGLEPGVVERVAVDCQRLGLRLQVHGLVGLPGESRAEALETLSFLARLREQHAAEPLVQFPVPLPGSDLAAGLGAERTPPADELPYAAFQSQPWPMPGAPPADFLRTALGELRRRLRVETPKLIVNLTYVCNNHCVFCAVGDRVARHADPQAVERALRDHWTRGRRMLDFDGGEPTLHPDLLGLVKLARGLGYRPITLITNGRRLAYRAFASQLARGGVDQVLISLHGPDAEVHEAITQAPGSFAQTWAGLRHALEALGDPGRVAVNTTLAAANLEALPALRAKLAEVGVKRWNLQVMTPFGRARCLPPLPREATTQALEALLTAPQFELALQVINCPPCRLPGREALAALDFGKSARDMAFVGEAGINLQEYLATRRHRIPACAGCAYALGCAGDWSFEGSPG